MALNALLLIAGLGSMTMASPVGFSYADPVNLFKRISSGCSTTGPASCHNTTHVSDLCCFESPGGLLLQTQFWDTNPSTGPSDSWTIHGLWPDNCDGTFGQDCDPSRAYTDIADLLSSQGASDTLSFMKEFWVDINGQNEQFWEHEWSKHGTCYSTLETSCLPSGSPRGAEAVAFFNTVVKLFKSLPTYQFLADAGITPSTSKTFSLSTLTDALKSATGVTPALDCSSGAINQISWYFNLKGSLLDGEFVPIDAPKKGSCASSGLKYPPKSGSSSSGPTSTSGGNPPPPTGAPGSLPAKAHLSASSTGGLLTAGTWSVQTPATYTLSGSTSSFTMSTSKGSCGVSSGQLICGSGVSASTFSAQTSGSNLLLAFGGSTAFTSDGTPSGSTQETVFTGSGHSVDFTISIVST
ncbi:ribonuclease T2 [Cristinia sonorae]|uniref:Ribonuclease T2-like n=1 Tax=Cristinia sonorae TaxID=1940300 RepID=A0A8K0XP58_9AGAR|nr:ribonuclease T2 [Cristinia sonorae]